MHFYALHEPSGVLTYQPFPSSVVGDLQMDNEVGPLGVPEGSKIATMA